MWRFKLSKNNYEKLKALVRDREGYISRAREYFNIIGEFPPAYGGQIHHVEWRSHGGGDREDNLILLSFQLHDRVHSASRKERKELEAKFLSYLSCGEVEKWRSEHREELEAIYRVAEEEMEKKKRNGCLPKKPKWAAF